MPRLHARSSRQADIPALILAGRLSVDMTFSQKVWALAARIPPGRVTTYAMIAHALGTRAYRAVGMALKRNPYAPAVPCHRVVGADGSLTGFAAGLLRKKRLLEAEGVRVIHGRADMSRLLRFARGSC